MTEIIETAVTQETPAPQEPATLTIVEKLHVLADLREQHNTLRLQNTERLKQVRDKYAEAFRRESDIAALIKSLETNIKSAASYAYVDNPRIGKKPFPGVGIRQHIYNAPQYPADKALAWAKQHDMCLQLDTVGFEKLCEAESTRPDFVVMVEETKTIATIATDLAKALEGVAE